MSKENEEQVNDLVRIVNRANAQNYVGSNPEVISVEDVGSYTVGLMDYCRCELYSFTDTPHNFHQEIIDQVTTSFMQDKEKTAFIRRHCKTNDEAVTFNAALESPLTDGTTVLYFAAFKGNLHHPAVIQQLDRKPKFYVIVGKTLEEVEAAYLEKTYRELAGE